ncbi:MAG: rhomboid family intramembrane serine protease [Calditrichaeota bacterium]|nr:rhomboid family intramembrane serine protease [Calditrichota bacterium]
MAKQGEKHAILCPACGKLVSAEAEVCIHCGYRRPGRRGITSVVRRLAGRGVRAVPVLIALCVVLYVVSLLLDLRAVAQPHGVTGLLAPSMWSLARLGMTGAAALFAGKWWTLITAIYLHGNLLHLLFNVLWIRQLGPAVEELFGTPRLLLIFTLSGAAGMLLSGLLGVGFTIGASGAIFGLMGALISYGRMHGGLMGSLLSRQLLLWAVVLLAMGFMMPGVNNVAHLVGFASGFFLAQLLGYGARRGSLGLQLAAAATVVLTLLCFVLALLA